MSEGEKSFDDLVMRESVAARARGRVVGVLWADGASEEERDRVLAFATQEDLDRWIDDDENALAAAKVGGNAVDDVLREVSRNLYLAIHGPGASIAEDQKSAWVFWDEIEEHVGDAIPNASWLAFYVGFVEGVMNGSGPAPKEV